MKYWSKALIYCLLILLVFPSMTLAQQAPALELGAKAAVLLDFQTGQILYSKNGQQPHVPASLAKIMTMYVTLDQIKAGQVSLDDTVVVSERAWRMIGSRMFLEPGEVVTVEQLLLGIAVVSGNDACVALAEGLAGSEAAFVQLMNEKARALDLPMHFVDVHGLSGENEVTAESVARLVHAYLMDHPDAIRFHREPSFSYQPRSSRTPIVQHNRNGLLRTYEGADGLKTGHLEVAGYNLVATAVQNNRRLIAVVLGSSSEAKREEEAAALLTYGYRNFDLVNIAPLLNDKTTRVYKGSKSQVGLMVAEPIIAVPKGVGATVSVGLQTKEVEAPVAKGTPVGVLSIYLQEELVKQVPLLAAEEVERGSWLKIMWDNATRFFRDLIRKPR
jgi:D-alanyl-D-alanine carboxypeptidase (penicillin-binding protein 5/6)